MTLPNAQEHAGTEGPPSPYRWVILFIAWIAFLLSFIDRLAWANVAVPVGESLGLTVAALGVFVTAFYIGYVTSNAIGGFFVDRLGGRLMLMLGLVFLGLFTFCFSYVRSVGTGIVLQALMGLAAGVDYAACIKLLTAWFGIRDRGRAVGFFLTATSLAVVTTNLIVPTLLKDFGWGGMYQGLGAVTMTCGIITFLVLRDAPSSASEKGVDRPNFAVLFHNRDLLFLAAAGFGALWGTWGVAFWANALLVKGHGFSVRTSRPDRRVVRHRCRGCETAHRTYFRLAWGHPQGADPHLSRRFRRHASCVWRVTYCHRLHAHGAATGRVRLCLQPAHGGLDRGGGGPTTCGIRDGAH